MKKFILSLLLLAVAALQFNTACAQVQNWGFQKSFIRNFKYPEVLRSACAPTFTNLKIDVLPTGKIGEMQISDSAPESFKNAFNDIKDSLDKSVLQLVIKANKLKNCHIIIPVFYVYASDYCTNSFEQAGYLSENYLLFNGNGLSKLSYNMKPIIISIYKPIH